MRKNTKIRITGIFLAAVVLLTVLPFNGKSAGMLCFTVTNDTLLPLADATMPTYFGSVLYVPYDIFNNVKVYNTTSRDLVCLYKGSKRVDFYYSRTYVSDQDGRVYDNVRPRLSGSTIYVPLDFVCSFFGLQYSLIPADPASILRIKNSDALLADRSLSTWLTYQMQRAYSDYTGSSEGQTPSANPGMSENPDTTTEVPPEPTYEDVTLFPYLYNLSDESAEEIVTELTYFGYKLSFFATPGDITGNPAMFRRIAGGGHTVGILLTEGTYNEYTETAELLFKTTKQRTLITISTVEAEDAARKMAAETGLIFCGTIDPEYEFKFNPAKPAESIPTEHGTRAALPIPISDAASATMTDLLSYLQEERYMVTNITETKVPPGVIS